MIMQNLIIFCFICITFTTLQTIQLLKIMMNYENPMAGFIEKRVVCNSFKGNEFQELNADAPETIEKAGFIDKKDIKFIIHGHAETHNDFLVSPVAEEFLGQGYNVLAINYQELSQNNCYRTGVENSLMISACAAKMIKSIIDLRDVKLGNFHLIGLSLGGQMVGQIPHFVDPIKYGKFSRVTGIDPANDGFFEDYEADKYILTKDDAELVDVIHSNSGFNGKFAPMGYIDWYPNLGIFQPGCQPGDHMCNHMRSLILFLESIGDPNFEIEAERCPNLETKFLNPQLCENKAKIRFGENFIKQGNNGGVYFFKTEEKAPYIRQSAKTDYDVYKIHLDFLSYYSKNTAPSQSKPPA